MTSSVTGLVVRLGNSRRSKLVWSLIQRAQTSATKRGVAERLRAERGRRADRGPALDAPSSDIACGQTETVNLACEHDEHK